MPKKRRPGEKKQGAGLLKEREKKETPLSIGKRLAARSRRKKPPSSRRKQDLSRKSVSVLFA